MSKRLIIVAIAVFVLVIAGATAVMAQEPDTNPTPGFGMFGRRADGFGFMQGHDTFGPMRGRGGNFGPMMGGQGAFGPMGGRGGNFGPMSNQSAFGPMGGRGMWGGAGYGLLPVAAEQLGMTLDELAAELQAGKTIAELAEAQEVDLQTIVDEYLATLQTEITDRLSEPWSGWGRGPAFIDEDGDGVCDHWGTINQDEDAE